MKAFFAFVCSCVAAGAAAASPADVVAADLSNRFPGEDAEMLGRVAAAAVARAAGDEGVSSDALAKDYSITCPLGWADAGDGSKCLAPFGYQGPCGDSAEFGGLAPHQKEALARDCGASFAFGDGAALLAIKRAEDALSKTCGPKCLSVFRAHASASALPEALGQAAAHAERSRNAAKQWLDVSGEASASVASGGTPCATPAACAVKSLGVNRCNFARAALQKTYEELNTATHVLGTAVSSLCGCVRVGDVSSCLLKSMPAACAFPYEVYSKAFSTSVSVWEAVKAASVKCAVHVDPAIAA
jgi:CPW-WPC domain-containing protein